MASYLNLFSYAASTVVIPISLVAITTEFGLSLTQAGALSLVGSISIFTALILSIPTSALLGKIRLLRWSLWLLAGGLLLFTRTHSYLSAMLTMIVIAFGQGVAEALLAPLVEDIHPGDAGSNQLLLQATWPFGIIFGTIIIGEILTRGLSWRWGFVFIAAVCFLVGVLYPPHRRVSLPVSRADFSHAGEVFSEPLFWIMGFVLFASGAVEGAFAYWTVSYIQLEFGTLARAGALGVVLFAAGMGLGRVLASRIMLLFGLRRFLILCMIAILLSSTGFFFVQSLPVLYVLMLFIGFVIAPLWPCEQTYTVRRMPGADHTMVMSFLSCFGILGYSGSSFLMGVIGDLAGLRMSFIVAPVMTLILLVLFLLEGRRKTALFHQESE